MSNGLEHHRLEVESNMAKTVAGQVLSMLEVEPSEVTSFEIEILSNGSEDGDTQTVIESSGPRADHIVGPMLSAADWDDNEPRQINVHVQTGGSSQSDSLNGDDPSVVSVDETLSVDEDAPTTPSVGKNTHAASCSLR